MAFDKNTTSDKSKAFDFADELGLETAKIYVGPERKQFVVHKQLLTSKSVFFDKALNGNFKEATENAIYLEEDDPAAVALMIGFLYRSIIPGTEKATSPFQKSLWVPSSPGPPFSAPGTEEPPFRPTISTEVFRPPWIGGVPQRETLQHIAYMPEYSDYSTEELRVTDYKCKRKYGAEAYPPFGPMPVVNMPTTMATHAPGQPPGHAPAHAPAQTATATAPNVSQPFHTTPTGLFSVNGTPVGGLLPISAPQSLLPSGIAAPAPMPQGPSLFSSMGMFGALQPSRTQQNTQTQSATTSLFTPTTTSSLFSIAPSASIVSSPPTVAPTATQTMGNAPSTQPATISQSVSSSSPPNVLASTPSKPTPTNDAYNTPHNRPASIASSSSASPTPKLTPTMHLYTRFQATASTQAFGHTLKIHHPPSPGVSLTGIPRSTPLGELMDGEDVYQLTLLKLSVLAEKCCWATLYNAAIEGYISGELNLYRPLPVEHVEIIYEKTHEESSLRVFVLDSLGRLDDRDVLDGYLGLAKKYEDFLEEVFLRVVNKKLGGDNGDGNWNGRCGPWGREGMGEVPLLSKYHMYENGKD